MRFTHALYLKMAASMKLTTKYAQRTLFSWNYDVGSADGDDMMVTMLTLKTLPVREVLIFRVKTSVKALNLRSYVPTSIAI